MHASAAGIGAKARRAAAALALAALAGATPVPLATVDQAAQLAALRPADARLATIGFRLAAANVALCDAREPGTGIVLQAIDQFDPGSRTAARTAFGFPAPVAIEVVLPGSPAARAGVLPGDGLVAVNGTAAPATVSSGATGDTRDAAWALIAGQAPEQPLALTLRRSGMGGARTETVMVQPRPVCRAAFEVLLGPTPVARSDGRIVQVGASYLDRDDDDALAVIVAHELSHIILHHRRRLEAAGAHWGLRAEFGHSAALFRQTEDEADALGAVLLRNAGWDPRLAVEFWRHRGGFLEFAGSHGLPRERAAAIERTVASIPPDAPTPWVPPLIARRDEPLR